MKNKYMVENGLFEFILALVIIVGIIVSIALDAPHNELLFSLGGTVIGYWFGNRGKTNGAYKAGKERGYLQAISDVDNGEDRLESVGSVTEVIHKHYG